MPLGAITNAQTPGVVSWSKTDAVSGALLAGSEWSLTGPGGFAKTVVDNGANDADPAVGVVAVEGLAWGEYALTETKAPAGYVLDGTKRPFTVSATALTVPLGAITNAQTPITVDPGTPPVPGDPAQPNGGAAVNTGGTSTGLPDGTAILWAGMIVGGLGLAMIALLVQRRRHRS